MAPDMKNLKAIRGRAYILDLISRGEHVGQDFKFAISDARKIARSISAFANNAGGHLLVGVKDNGTIAGVRNDEDIYVIEQAARLYCRPSQEVEFTAFNTGDTGIVIRARVEKADERPVYAQDSDRCWKAYFRVADENISAHPLMVRTWRRMASQEDVLMNIDGPERMLVDALQRHGWLRMEEALLSTGASRKVAEAAIIRLAALGVVCFDYRSGEFGVLVGDG